MTEHNNPLMRSNPGNKPGGATIEDLQRHVDYLNSFNWVKASGRPYFVAKSTDDLLGVHFVSRRA